MEGLDRGDEPTSHIDNSVRLMNLDVLGARVRREADATRALHLTEAITVRPVAMNVLPNMARRTVPLGTEEGT
jgi:hypothetical protein